MKRLAVHYLNCNEPFPIIGISEEEVYTLEQNKEDNETKRLELAEKTILQLLPPLSNELLDDSIREKMKEESKTKIKALFNI